MAKDWQLKGKTAVVTGCDNVLGAAIAKALAGEGVSVIAVGSDQGALDRAVKASGATKAIRVDYGDAGAAASVAKQAGGADILVNATAGLKTAVNTPIDIADAAWQTEMTTEFEFPRALTHALLPGMTKNEWGRVINIVGGSEPYDLGVEYAASGALQAWSKGLCRAVGRQGVTVNCVQPGLIKGTQAAKDYVHIVTERTEDPMIPFGEPGEPEDVAYSVVYLCSPLAHYVTGIVLPVDGGLGRHQH
ncbi:MAG: SDR family oxidoreductase [Rhodospirillales bacterium]